MGSRLDAVCVQADDPHRLARFWADILGRALDASTDSSADVDVVPTDDTGVRIRFLPAHGPRSGPNRMHFHLTSTSAVDQAATVRRVLALGGRHLDVGQRPEEGHVVLADPEGNEFCVIEPDNTFLAGCGFLGELACDGSQAVGRFWSAALDWPLVWDQDQETAIQSPHGGPKIAWAGPPVTPAKDRGGLHFDLTPPASSDVETEVERLVSLGATQIETDATGPWVVLADPDGNAFRLLKRSA